MDWALPESVDIEGKEYLINTDFRDVLNIITCMQREEDPTSQVYIALMLFYEAFDSMPPLHWPTAWEHLCEFIRCGEAEPEGNGPKLLDWEQDYEMIAAEVNRIAGMEVRCTAHLHWFTFMGYFRCIGEGQLATVVGIRAKRARGKRLEDWEQEFYRQNRKMVDLKGHYTKQEIADRERLRDLLRGGNSG